MTTLEDFIFRLKKFIDAGQEADKDDLLVHVKSPANLLYALRDLNNHVGNDGIKKKILNQTIFLIKRKKRISEGEKIEAKNMLNVCLYGGPGIGKTTIAKIMGRLILSVGSMKNNKTKASKMMDRVQEPGRSWQLYILFIIALFVIPLFVDPMMMILVTLIFLAIAFFIVYTDNTVNNKTETLEEDHEGSVILCSKVDLVAGYLGQSQPKTRAVLERARGGVLIIDEAYELVSGDKDLFGQEVLTEINLYMSEHPDEISIIMCGYKEHMNKNIFSIQPGLERRFMWHFECEEYSPEELLQIFEMQLKKEGYKICPKDKSGILRLFSNHNFRNQGGDTEKLSFLVAMNKEGDLDVLTSDRTIKLSDVLASIPDLGEEKRVGKKDHRDMDTGVVIDSFLKSLKR